MEELKKKIEKLIVTQVGRNHIFTCNEEIEEYETKISLKFPEDYKWFLLNYCDCMFYFEAKLWPIKADPRSTDGYSPTAYFYGSDINERRNSELWIHEDQYLPIGDVNGYSLCMGMTEENYGKIYTWVFDEPNIDGTQYYLTAESFTDYIMRVELPSEKGEAK